LELKFNSRKLFRSGIHIIFWICAWLFFLFYYERYSEVNIYTIVASLVNLAVAIGTVYTFNYYLIPRFLLKERHIKFIAFSVIAIIIFIYLQLMLTVILFIKLLYTEQTLFPKMIDVVMLFFNLFFIVFIAISIKFYKRWTEKDHKSQVIQREKVEAELQMLKTQINPHFLFNTLNSIYVLALRNAEKTAETVLQLSDILDYILYKLNEPTVLFSDELHIIENYISLEKIRFADRVELNLKVEVNDKDLKIPPMLIIPFVENAFKHGVGKSMDKSWINIEIRDTDDFLNIDVGNSRKPGVQKSKSSGIGLENTIKRLNILYNNNYTFDKIETEYNYQIKLQLPKMKKL
jgi:sensor histidine kinase YesM